MSGIAYFDNLFSLAIELLYSFI